MSGSSTKQTTLLLADEQAIVRQGLRVLLEAEPDFRVVGESGDGLETLRLIEQLQPEVVVLDLALPGLNGLEVIRQSHRRSRNCRLVVFSMPASETQVLEALQRGAVAFVLKQASASDLVRALREVLAGHRFLSLPFSERAIEAYVRNGSGSGSDRYDTLTDRERQVLQLTAEGLTSREIGQRLFTSHRTVELQRATMMRKLAVHSRTEVVRYALARGLLLHEPASGLRDRA